MPTDDPRPATTGLTKRLTRVPAFESSLPAWSGTTIMVRHGPDGTVTATSRGFSAVAGTEGAALAELARLIKAAGMIPAPADTLRTIAKPTG